MRISKEYKQKAFLGGIAFGFLMIIFALSLPLAYITIRDEQNLVSMDTAGFHLQLAGLRIHHYLIGILIVSLTYLSKNKMKKYAYFAYGIGAALIIDQIPSLLKGDFGISTSLVK